MLESWRFATTALFSFKPRAFEQKIHALIKGKRARCTMYHQTLSVFLQAMRAEHRGVVFPCSHSNTLSICYSAFSDAPNVTISGLGLLT